MKEPLDKRPEIGSHVMISYSNEKASIHGWRERTRSHELARMTSGSHAYRTPRDPGGFPFGYNWRATGLGLTLLVGFNLATTQFIAADFRYQPELGRLGREGRTHHAGNYRSRDRPERCYSPNSSFVLEPPSSTAAIRS